MIPHVAGMMVGFYKKTTFVEFDCPFCGKVHTFSMPSIQDEQPLVRPSCCDGVVIVTGCVAYVPMEIESE